MNPSIVPASALGLGYSRGDGTATWSALEEAVGQLEGGTAVAFASGIATVSAVLDALPVGTGVAVPTDSYMGTRDVFEHADSTGRIRLRRIAPEDTAVWVGAAAEVGLLWLESPTNPSLAYMDIPAIAAAAAEQLRRPLVVADNTFATPLGDRPLSHGADISVHSASKLIGGHSDLLLGLAVAKDEALVEALRDARTRGGATPGALEAWLALRGLRTLPVRYAEVSRTAALLAERLGKHPAVVGVRYPGAGAMIAFELGGAAAADRLCASLRLVRHATSLGGVESTVERRAARAGEEHVAAGLLRFSVGLEDPDDLWQDLDRALEV